MLADDGEHVGHDRAKSLRVLAVACLIRRGGEAAAVGLPGRAVEDRERVLVLGHVPAGYLERGVGGLAAAGEHHDRVGRPG